MGPDTVISGAEEEVIEVGSNDELPGEVVNRQSESEYRSSFADLAPVGGLEHGGERDQAVAISDTEGGQLAEHVQSGYTSEKERRQDEHEAEKEQPAGQSQRPVRERKPSDSYGG